MGKKTTKASKAKSVALSHVPPRRGPGRPPKPKPPPTAIEIECRQAEEDRVGATAAYRAAPTIANKVALLATEMRVHEAHAAACRLTGDYTHGLKCTELVVKLSAQHAIAIEQKFVDDLNDMEKRTRRDRDAASRTGKKAGR